MPGQPVFHTQGLVLRSVKYGETSLIVTVFTQLFGLQSYLVNGVRMPTKKGSGQGNYFQPAALLDLVVYHNELKHLQRIREFKWAYLYKEIYFNVLKNSVALFMTELLQKTLRQPEPNPELFHFIEDAFMHLDQSSESVAANFPLFFLTQLTFFSGMQLSDTYTESKPYLDLQEGRFVSEPPAHTYAAGKPYSALISQLLKVMQPHELEELRLNQELRRQLLKTLLAFYTLHIPDFGHMKTVEVLQEIWS